jgi:MFS family permease
VGSITDVRHCFDYCSWAGGLVLGAIGIYVHQLWLMWLSSGVIGGIGLGLGYISPVSTLIKWFPDHRGMATGMAIAGFGGGTMSARLWIISKKHALHRYWSRHADARGVGYFASPAKLSQAAGG